VSSLRPDLPVLYVSGYADERLTADVLADPDRFLAKPYEAAALAVKVRHLIDTQGVH
jgi:CheY-like chemotaxis protein